jgi:hypothetical protein
MVGRKRRRRRKGAQNLLKRANSRYNDLLVVIFNQDSRKEDNVIDSPNTPPQRSSRDTERVARGPLHNRGYAGRTGWKREGVAVDVAVEVIMLYTQRYM